MKYRNRSKGFALVTVLVVVIVVAALSAGVIQVLNSYTSLKQVSLEGIKAQYLAEAAMQWALYQCRSAGGVCPTTEDTVIQMPSGDLSDGMTSVISINAGPGGTYDIKTTITY